MTLSVKTTPRKTIPAVRSVEIEYNDMIEMVRGYLRNQGVAIGDDEVITLGGLNRYQVRHGGNFWLDVHIAEHIATS